MRKFKALLLFVLCIVLPVQGIAAITTFEVSCPMSLTMADDAADSMPDASVSADCCNDAATFAKTGKACKSGQECQSGFQYTLFPAFSKSYMAFAAERIPHVETIVLASFATNVWRPPV